MRKMLFLFLGLPIAALSQIPQKEKIFENSIPAGLGQRIHLPERRYNPDFILDQAEGYRLHTRIFIIKTDSVYRNLLFKEYHYPHDSLKHYKFTRHDFYDSLGYNEILHHLSDSLAVIDFTRQELILYSACAKCLEVCRHKEGMEGCHRSACQFMDVWFVRDKEPLIVKKAEKN
ncbi:MAG: hypothetical protein IPI68_01560 [Chitinophagaceae bacterium]|nr:hypothetical protein [Chitinophagaceae bacterium]